MQLGEHYAKLARHADTSRAVNVGMAGLICLAQTKDPDSCLNPDRTPTVPFDARR